MNKILTYPNEILTKKSEPVKLPLSETDKKILNQMYDYVKTNHKTAVGLSAPQIGINKQLVAIYFESPSGRTYAFKLANPTFKPVQKNKRYFVPGGETCLSEPGISVGVKRYQYVILTGYDLITDKVISVQLDHFPASIVQHECDHLSGILLHSYLS